MAPNPLLMFLLLAHCIGLTFADGPPRLVRDGIGEIYGFDGVSYRAVNYLPVYGALTLSNTDDYDTWSNMAICDTSMSSYNQTTNTSAVYDHTGVPSSVQIGTGTPLCLCFSLGGGQGQMNMCISILSDGTPDSYGETDIGTFASNADKAIPQCKNVDVSSISASVYSKLGATSSGSAPGATNSTMIITTTSGSLVQTLTALVAVPIETTPTGNSTGNSESGDVSKGLSKENKIAIGVGLGMVSKPILGDAVVIE